MLRVVWQALNCLSIHATCCVIVAGASPGETKMWAAVRENGDFLHLRFEYLGNCWRQMSTCCETICKHRILFPSIQHLAWLPQGRTQGKQKCGKIAIFGFTHCLKHRITRKLLKIDRYILRVVWQALNCLSIHATYCVIVAGASPA